jgi:hypothetical protein
MKPDKKAERMHDCATCAITRVVGGEPIPPPRHKKILVRTRLSVAERPAAARGTQSAGDR